MTFTYTLYEDGSATSLTRREALTYLLLRLDYGSDRGPGWRSYRVRGNRHYNLVVEAAS